MRRTRHVMLPVRSWQYIGLLVVSLACLTLGLVSRDREGRAGSLAGPELEHRAPHEVDACPNINPLAKSATCSSTEQPRIGTLQRTAPKTRISGRSLTPNHLRVSRSFSLDRVSRIRDIGSRAYSRVDLRRGRSLDRDTSRTERRESADSLRQRVIRQNDRFDVRDRRARGLERRENRGILERTRTTELRNRENRQNALRILDRTSRSLEGRENRGTLERARETELRSRQNRLETREHRRVRSVDRRESDTFDRREIRDVVRNRVLAHRRISRSDLWDARSNSLNRRQSNDVDRRANREASANRRTLEGRELSERVNRRGEILDQRTRSTAIRENGRTERRVNPGREIERETSRQERRSLERRREAQSRSNVIESERRTGSVDQLDKANGRARISRRSVLSRDNRSNLRENRRDVRSIDERRTPGYSVTLRDKVDRTAQRNSLRASRSFDRRTSENRENYADRGLSRNSRDDRDRRVNEASRDRDSPLRSKERLTLIARRERTYLTRPNPDRRNSRVQLRLSRDTGLETDRRSLLKLERRERLERLDRQSERTALLPLSGRRESSFSRNARSERRERTYRLLLTHEPRESRRTDGLAAEAARRISRSESLENESAIRSSSRDRRRTNNRIEDRTLQRRNLDGRASALSDGDIRLIRKENSRVGNQRSRSADFTAPIPSSERDSPNRRSSNANGRRFSESSVLRRSIRVSEEKGFRENRYSTARERMIYGGARGKDIISRARYANTLNFPKKEDSSSTYGLPLEIMRQALIVGLCTVYGLATINNKGSIVGNIARWTPRFMVW